MQSEQSDAIKFARYAEIMPYYTGLLVSQGDIVFARYAEIMPYYTLIISVLFIV